LEKASGLVSGRESESESVSGLARQWDSDSVLLWAPDWSWESDPARRSPRREMPP
jgi:hypothetical protein